METKTKVKKVLLQLTEEEHKFLKQIKKELKLSWEGFVLYLSHSHLNTEETEEETELETEQSVNLSNKK